MMNQSERRKYKELEKRVSALENKFQDQLSEKLQQNIKFTCKEKPMKSEQERPETLRYAVWAP